MKAGHAFWAAIGFLLLISCMRESIEPPQSSPHPTSEKYNVLVDTSNPWFANLDVSDSFMTKADGNASNLQTLNSLLNFNEKISYTISDRCFTQTPFLTNSVKQLFYEASDLSALDRICVDSVLIAKKYLIESGSGEDRIEYVVTMLARWNYCEEYGYDNISFLNRPDFSGYLIFSDIDCKYNYISCYKDGVVYRSEFESVRAESDNSLLSHSTYLVAFSMISTKAVILEDGSINAGYLNEITVEYKSKQKVNTEDDNADSDIVSLDPEFFSGSGGGGGHSKSSSNDSNNSSQGDDDTDEDSRKIQEEAQRLEGLLNQSTITLESNVSEIEKERLKTLEKEFASVAALAPVSNGWNLLSNILDKLDTEKIEFVISADLSKGNGNNRTSVSHTTSKITKYKVTIMVDQLTNLKTFAHELFHCFQYSDMSNVFASGKLIWNSGDLEFEAFLFEALMINNDVISSTEFDDTDLFAAINYINHPGEQTYKAALEAYRTLKNEYAAFPMTNNMNPFDRIRHLL